MGVTKDLDMLVVGDHYSAFLEFVFLPETFDTPLAKANKAVLQFSVGLEEHADRSTHHYLDLLGNMWLCLSNRHCRVYVNIIINVMANFLDLTVRSDQSLIILKVSSAVLALNNLVCLSHGVIQDSLLLFDDLFGQFVPSRLKLGVILERTPLKLLRG